MRALDLFTSRKYSTVTLSDKKEYKIPNEYTVEEVERLLELRVEQEALEAESVSNTEAQIKQFWEIVFSQLEIIFQHYQEDVTREYLKKVVTHNEALEIIGFFQKYRHSAIKELLSNTPTNSGDSKKKVKPAKTELRDLRRLVTFMVVSGFSLLEVRKLYIDEMYTYYEELFYTLEKLGKVKDGSYAKIKRSDNSTQVEDTVSQLRKQLFKSIASKK